MSIIQKPPLGKSAGWGERAPCCHLYFCLFYMNSPDKISHKKGRGGICNYKHLESSLQSMVPGPRASPKILLEVQFQISSPIYRIRNCGGRAQDFCVLASSLINTFGQPLCYMMAKHHFLQEAFCNPIWYPLPHPHTSYTYPTCSHTCWVGCLF